MQQNPAPAGAARTLEDLAREFLRTGARVALIGGTSHAGKSSVAAAIGKAIGWSVRPADTIARHPGRPWPAERGPVPAHVAEHYRNLPQPALLADVIRHYANVWGIVRGLIDECVSGGPELVIEGSAVMPAFAAPFISAACRGCWIVVPDHIVDARIRANSRFDTLDEPGRKLVDVFIERTKRFNARVLTEAAATGVPVMALTGCEAIEDAAAACLERLIVD